MQESKTFIEQRNTIHSPHYESLSDHSFESHMVRVSKDGNAVGLTSNLDRGQFVFPVLQCF